jgi:hypothetical protein
MTTTINHYIGLICDNFCCFFGMKQFCALACYAPSSGFLVCTLFESISVVFSALSFADLPTYSILFKKLHPK